LLIQACLDELHRRHCGTRSRESLDGKQENDGSGLRGGSVVSVGDKRRPLLILYKYRHEGALNVQIPFLATTLPNTVYDWWVFF
jgi:hypothetical protein